MDIILDIIEYDEWLEKYKPLTHSFNGDEEEFKTTDPLKIWTECSGDDDYIYIASGYHFVNSLRYFITEVPFEDGEKVIVNYPYEEDEDD